MQNEIPKPMFSNVREKVALIEANQRSQIAPNGSERDFQDEDTTGDFTGQHNWRAEVSSDMSTTPLSPRRPDYFQRLITKPQVAPIASETGLADSPSFVDGITAAIPNVQDLLAADAGTPESELGWNPRKIVWSAQQSNRQTMARLALPYFTYLMLIVNESEFVIFKIYLFSSFYWDVVCNSKRRKIVCKYACSVLI